MIAPPRKCHASTRSAAEPVQDEISSVNRKKDECSTKAANDKNSARRADSFIFLPGSIYFVDYQNTEGLEPARRLVRST